MSASVTFNISGTELTLVRPVRYRYADRVRGELRRDLNVVPELSVGFDSDLLVVPTAGAPQGQRLVVTATSFVNRSVTGALRLRLPAGWTSSPASAPFLGDVSGRLGNGDVRGDATGAPNSWCRHRFGRGRGWKPRLLVHGRDRLVSTHSEPSAVLTSSGAGRGDRPRGRTGARRLHHGQWRRSAGRPASYGR